MNLFIMPPVYHHLALRDFKIKLVHRAEGAGYFVCETEVKSSLGCRFELVTLVLLQEAQLADEDIVLGAIEYDRLTLVLLANLSI